MRFYLWLILFLESKSSDVYTIRIEVLETYILIQHVYISDIYKEAKLPMWECLYIMNYPSELSIYLMQHQYYMYLSKHSSI